jgi:hypothetical protein
VERPQAKCDWNQVGVLQQARWRWLGDQEQSKIGG